MTGPITGLDHIAIHTGDPVAAVRDYQAVLGTSQTAKTAAGQTRLQLGNMALEIASLDGSTAAVDAANAPRTALGLAFAVGDLEQAGHRLARRASPSVRGADGRRALDQAATHAVSIALVAGPQGGEAARQAPGEVAAGGIIGLDHVVVRTGDPERAVALYGGRLGLDLRLDRTNPERGNRLLFFVCGDLVVEISHDTRKGVTPGPDSIWGLAWRTIDVHAARGRMLDAGIAVSEIRTGNRPGTEVFTVKSHTAGVPTLVIGGHGLVRR